MSCKEDQQQAIENSLQDMRELLRVRKMIETLEILYVAAFFALFVLPVPLVYMLVELLKEL